MIKGRDFDGEGLFHYTEPRSTHKIIIIAIITAIPLLCILCLIYCRKQLAALWVRIRKWNVGMPRAENMQEIRGVGVGVGGGREMRQQQQPMTLEVEQAGAKGTSDRNLVLPFQGSPGREKA